MKLILPLLLLLGCGTKHICAQSLNAGELEKTGNELVRLELQAGDGITSPDDNCLRDTAGHFLSCYYAESSSNWVSDFNGDGHPDAIFRFMDEGLGGGGNAFGFDYRLVLLDGQRNIIKQHSIFGGGKFSYGHLEIDQVNKRKIYATYNENPMSREGAEDPENLKSVQLVFTLADDKVVEDGYSRCPLAAMKKQLFKKDKGLQVRSSADLDDQFNAAFSEQVTMPDSSLFNAQISGCEDLDLYFSRTIAYKKTLETNKTAMKQELLDNLFFLKENTLFKTVINNAYTQLKKRNNELIKTGQYGGTTIHLSLPDRWQAHLFLSGNEEQGSFITIRFEKPKYAAAMDFWESLESKQRLK